MKELTPLDEARSLIGLAKTRSEIPPWLKEMMDRWLKANPKPETPEEAGKRIASEALAEHGP